MWNLLVRGKVDDEVIVRKWTLKCQQGSVVTKCKLKCRTRSVVTKKTLKCVQLNVSSWIVDVYQMYLCS